MTIYEFYVSPDRRQSLPINPKETVPMESLIPHLPAARTALLAAVPLLYLLAAAPAA